MSQLSICWAQTMKVSRKDLLHEQSQEKEEREGKIRRRLNSMIPDLTLECQSTGHLVTKSGHHQSMSNG